MLSRLWPLSRHPILASRSDEGRIPQALSGPACGTNGVMRRRTRCRRKTTGSGCRASWRTIKAISGCSIPAAPARDKVVAGGPKLVKISLSSLPTTALHSLVRLSTACLSVGSQGQSQWQHTLDYAVLERKPHSMVLSCTRPSVDGSHSSLRRHVHGFTRKSASPRHLAAAHSVTFRLFRRLQTRMEGTGQPARLGYDRSAEYVANQLRNAGYKVRLEEFTFPVFDDRSPPLLVAGSTHPGLYTPSLDALRTLRNSGSGEVTALPSGR